MTLAPVIDRDLTEPVSAPKAAAAAIRPRLGFLGVGWIGRNRMEAILNSGAATVAAIADPCPAIIEKAAALAPQAVLADSLDGLLEAELDGVVIATPSALHAEQAVAALERGVAVFCQKPLGRDASETRRVIDAARFADRLLGVDLSYRFIEGVRRVHQLCRGGALGTVYAVDLVFHNAYGPDKPWFYDPRQSGGGCVIDLGIHLVDLALWNLGFPRIERVSSRLFTSGERVSGRSGLVEDYAVARLDTESGATIQLACSWKLHAGREAVISGAFHGIQGGAAFHNVNGSFYEFEAEQFRGTHSTPLAKASAGWGGRAAVDWTRRLAAGERFNPEIQSLTQVADALDRIYTDARMERPHQP